MDCENILELVSCWTVHCRASTGIQWPAQICSGPVVVYYLPRFGSVLWCQSRAKVSRSICGSILPVSIVFFPPLFFLSFFHLQFTYPSFFPFPPPPPPPLIPFPSPTPEDFFPAPNLNLWIFHGCLRGNNQSLKIMMVVEGGGGRGGGGGVALVTFNSRRPLPSTGITRIILWIFHGSRLVCSNIKGSPPPRDPPPPPPPPPPPVPPPPPPPPPS